MMIEALVIDRIESIIELEHTSNYKSEIRDLLENYGAEKIFIDISKYDIIEAVYFTIGNTEININL